MYLENIIKSLKQENLYRERNILEGKKIFCSNDYLGLSKNPEVIAYVIEIIKKEGLGSTASPLVNGYTIYHKRLEKALSSLKDTQDCLIFPSGYSANVGLMQALGEDGVFYSDELNHASIIDGIRLSKAPKYVYKHNDMNDLFELLKRTRKHYKNAYIVSDSVFSMEGDIVNLIELLKLAYEFDAHVILDEAHATGTIGKGVFDYYKFKIPKNVIIMGTLSKAIGSQGGFVCGDKILIDYLVNKARSYIFSTSLGIPMVSGALKAVELISSNLDNYVKSLKDITYKMIHNLKEYFDIEYKNTPIIPLKVNDEDKALKIRDKLLEKNIFIQAIRYPTVPRNKAILRLTASLGYSDKDLDMLFDAFKSIKDYII